MKGLMPSKTKLRCIHAKKTWLDEKTLEFKRNDDVLIELNIMKDLPMPVTFPSSNNNKHKFTFCVYGYLTILISG